MTNALGVTQKEFLIQLNSERLARVAQGLERNWTVQLVLAGVGFALVFDIGDLPKFLSSYVSQQEYNLRPVAAILLAILLYYFMKLGRLLSAFIETRKLNDRLLDEYLGERNLEALHATENFFEFFYAPDTFGRPLVAAYYLISAITISTGQAAALYLILKAYEFSFWSRAAVLLAVVAMGLLYVGFWRSKRKHPGTTAMVIACSVMTVLLFSVFIVCAPREEFPSVPARLSLRPRSLPPRDPYSLLPTGAPSTEAELERVESSGTSASQHPAAGEGLSLTLAFLRCGQTARSADRSRVPKSRGAQAEPWWPEDAIEESETLLSPAGESVCRIKKGSAVEP